jgi:hypothetical protein
MLRKFQVTFCGRKLNAIGRFENYTIVVSAKNEEKARLKLYDNYDHIQILKVKEI